MAVTFRIVNEDKVLQEYRVKDYDELTLADWRALTVPKIEEGIIEKMKSKLGLRAQIDTEHELIKRHTGISKAMLKRLPPSEYDTLVNTLGETLKLAAEEGGKEDKGYIPPSEVTVGKTFTVPKDLEKDTIAGQWWDLNTADDFEDEVSVVLRFLAVLLTEPQQEYDGEQVAEREKVLLSMNMVEAYRLCTFFFSSSERFRSAMSLAFHRYSSSKQHSAREVLKSLVGSTERISASAVQRS